MHVYIYRVWEDQDAPLTVGSDLNQNSTKTEFNTHHSIPKFKKNEYSLFLKRKRKSEAQVIKWRN